MRASSLTVTLRASGSLSLILEVLIPCLPGNYREVYLIAQCDLTTLHRENAIAGRRAPHGKIFTSRVVHQTTSSGR
jgi:hypothetical protein